MSKSRKMALLKGEILFIGQVRYADLKNVILP
jgi:hypothetical protein